MPRERAHSMHGYGLRVPHYDTLLERGARGDLFEVISENFLGRGGRARSLLHSVRRDAHIALHGVSLSLGGCNPLSETYLDALDALQREIEPLHISDHACFGTVGGHHGHDLWPLPYTEEAIAHVAERITRVQERLKQRILIENVSSYISYRDSEMSEHEFMVALLERADCFMLLDVNNIVVNAKNHGISADEYIQSIPVERVAQLHLAGHTDLGTHAIDDHGSPVPPAVWSLYDQVVARFGRVPAIIEWDENVPTLDALEEQSAMARAREQSMLSRLVTLDEKPREATCN